MRVLPLTSKKSFKKIRQNPLAMTKIICPNLAPGLGTSNTMLGICLAWQTQPSPVEKDSEWTLHCYELFTVRFRA